MRFRSIWHSSDVANVLSTVTLSRPGTILSRTMTNSHIRLLSAAPAASDSTSWKSFTPTVASRSISRHVPILDPFLILIIDNTPSAEVNEGAGYDLEGIRSARTHRDYRTYWKNPRRFPFQTEEGVWGSWCHSQPRCRIKSERVSMFEVPQPDSRQITFFQEVRSCSLHGILIVGSSVSGQYSSCSDF